MTANTELLQKLLLERLEKAFNGSNLHILVVEVNPGIASPELQKVPFGEVLLATPGKVEVAPSPDGSAVLIHAEPIAIRIL